jgi:hypothetical protein
MMCKVRGSKGRAKTDNKRAAPTTGEIEKQKQKRAKDKTGWHRTHAHYMGI